MVIQLSIRCAGSVDVQRFCHPLIVQGKCHHEGDGDIEQEGTEKVGSVKPGRGGQKWLAGKHLSCWTSPCAM